MNCKFLCILSGWKIFDSSVCIYLFHRYDSFIVFDTTKNYGGKIPLHFDVLTELIHNCCMIARDVSITNYKSYPNLLLLLNFQQKVSMKIQCWAQIIRKVEGHKLNASTFYGHFTFVMSMKYNAECIVYHRNSNELKLWHFQSDFVSKMEFVCSNS